MNTKTILGISIVAVFAVSSIGFVSAGVEPSWFGLVAGTIEIEEKNNITKLTASATGEDPIDRKTSEFWGFAWFYDAATMPEHTAFAITTHSADVSAPNDFGDYDDNNARNDFRDSTQNPDGWHGHNVILLTNSDTNAIGTHCIVDLSDAPNVGISLDDEDPLISVKVKNSALTGQITDAAASFQIIVDSTCDPTIGTTGYLGGNGPARLGLTAIAPISP